MKIFVCYIFGLFAYLKRQLRRDNKRLGRREGSGIVKRPQDSNSVALFVGALVHKAMALTILFLKLQIN